MGLFKDKSMVLVVIWEMKQGEIQSEMRDRENLRKGLIFGSSTRQQVGSRWVCLFLFCLFCHFIISQARGIYFYSCDFSSYYINK